MGWWMEPRCVNGGLKNCNFQIRFIIPGPRAGARLSTVVSRGPAAGGPPRSGVHGTINMSSWLRPAAPVSSEGAEDDLKVDAAKCLSREARLLHLAKGEELHVEHLAAGRLDAANAHPVLRGRPAFCVLHIFCARSETREERVSRACMRDCLWTARTNAPPFMATFQSVSEISAATIVSPRSMAPDPVSSIILSNGAARADQ